MKGDPNTKSGTPLNLLGLVARWRSGDHRDAALPGVPWTAGEVGDALAPVLRGRESTQSEVAAIAARGINDPRSLNADEIRSVCASALTQVESKGK